MITYIKAEEVSSANVCITIIRPTPEPGNPTRNQSSITNEHRPVEGTHDWARYELIFDVPNDASSIQITFSMKNAGKIWVDSFQFENVEKHVPLVGLPRFSPLPQQPHNLHFARGLESWSITGSFPQDYTSGVDDIITADGTACAYLKANALEPRGSVILDQTLRGPHYPGKRVRFSARVKSVGIEQKASLFLYSGGEERQEYTIEGNTEWIQQDLIVDIPPLFPSLSFGMALHGKGQIWLQDVHLEMVNP